MSVKARGQGGDRLGQDSIGPMSARIATEAVDVPAR